jgi:hypothetical protein
LQRDPTKDVADRHVDIPADRRADGIRDLGQVGGEGEHNQPANGAAEVQLVVEHIRRLRQLDAGDPDYGCGPDEDGDEQSQREGVHLLTMRRACSRHNIDPIHTFWPISLAYKQKRPPAVEARRWPVAPTGVDPVTFRFSVERSTN